jgi:hypothetical protein
MSYHSPATSQTWGKGPSWGCWVRYSVPRSRYRQDPLPLGADAPAPELFGPEQPLPSGMQVAEQGQLEVMPLGPLFDQQRQGISSEERP